MAVAEHRFRAMGSDVHLLVVDGPDDAGDRARSRVSHLEACWSRFDTTSDVSRLNQARGAAIQVDAVTQTLVRSMIQASSLTRGLYDPTILPVLLDLGYDASVEDPAARTTAPAVAPDHGYSVTDALVDGSAGTITLPSGVAIDPGGIGKGLAADLVVADLLDHGCGGALLSIGGDLAAAGQPPSADGWTVALEDPQDLHSSLGRISLSGGGVATSTARSQHWRPGDTGGPHVIDPRTGRPTGTDLVATTVIAPCGWLAEVHATALLLAGRKAFHSLADTHRLHALAVTAEGTVLATAALTELSGSAMRAMRDATEAVSA